MPIQIPDKHLTTMATALKKIKAIGGTATGNFWFGLFKKEPVLLVTLQAKDKDGGKVLRASKEVIKIAKKKANPAVRGTVTWNGNKLIFEGNKPFAAFAKNAKLLAQAYKLTILAQALYKVSGSTEVIDAEQETDSAPDAELRAWMDALQTQSTSLSLSDESFTITAEERAAITTAVPDQEAIDSFMTQLDDDQLLEASSLKLSHSMNKLQNITALKDAIATSDVDAITAKLNQLDESIGLDKSKYGMPPNIKSLSKDVRDKLKEAKAALYEALDNDNSEATAQTLLTEAEELREALYQDKRLFAVIRILSNGKDSEFERLLSSDEPQRINDAFNGGDAMIEEAFRYSNSKLSQLISNLDEAEPRWNGPMMLAKMKRDQFAEQTEGKMRFLAMELDLLSEIRRSYTYNNLQGMKSKSLYIRYVHVPEDIGEKMNENFEETATLIRQAAMEIWRPLRDEISGLAQAAETAATECVQLGKALQKPKTPLSSDEKRTLKTEIKQAKTEAKRLERAFISRLRTIGPELNEAIDEAVFLVIKDIAKTLDGLTEKQRTIKKADLLYTGRVILKVGAIIFNFVMGVIAFASTGLGNAAGVASGAIGLWHGATGVVKLLELRAAHHRSLSDQLVICREGVEKLISDFSDAAEQMEEAQAVAEQNGLQIEELTKQAQQDEIEFSASGWQVFQNDAPRAFVSLLTGKEMEGSIAAIKESFHELEEKIIELEVELPELRNNVMSWLDDYERFQGLQIALQRKQPDYQSELTREQRQLVQNLEEIQHNLSHTIAEIDEFNESTDEAKEFAHLWKPKLDKFTKNHWKMLAAIKAGEIAADLSSVFIPAAVAVEMGAEYADKAAYYNQKATEYAEKGGDYSDKAAEYAEKGAYYSKKATDYAAGGSKFAAKVSQGVMKCSVLASFEASELVDEHLAEKNLEEDSHEDHVD